MASAVRAGYRPSGGMGGSAAAMAAAAAMTTPNLHTPAPTALAMNVQLTMNQMDDEQEHKHLAEVNHQDLLNENLARLRGLTKMLEADSWKYSSTSSSSTSAAASVGPPLPSSGSNPQW